VPVHDATLDGDDLRLSYTKDKVKDAPSVDVDAGHLSEEEEGRLYAYYGRGDEYATAGVGGVGVGGEHTSAGIGGVGQGTDTSVTTGRGVEGRDLSGPETDEAMTRSEEHLRVGTTSEEAGRVRLRKYVTTETETQTVPVRKERAVLETEPITDGNVGEALDGPAISEEEHEVVLHEERPVTETVVEPVERVRVGTESTVEDETVTGEVRKEQIEADGDVERR
jgi:uncharacterized protein (TIGR02271 family)